MSSPKVTTASEKEILSWANDIFPYRQVVLVAEHPWSRVYQLDSSDGKQAFLKVFPETQESLIQKNKVIHQQLAFMTPNILGSNAQLNAMIFKSHQAISIGLHSSSQQLQNVLKSYAELQVQAKENISALKLAVPTVDVASILDELIEFLNKETDSDSLVGASYFMEDSKEAIGYGMAIASRKDFMQNYFSVLEDLPVTLNHCDLHTDNISERPDGTVLFYDWDDAFIGPVGMSLHRLFEGASSIAKYLHYPWMLDEALEKKQGFLYQYYRILEEGEYANPGLIKEALPAAACIGLIKNIISYQYYPQDNYQYKENIRKIIRNGVEDVIHLCDVLALQNRNDTLHFAKDYYDNHVPWRSIYLLDQYSQQHPNDLAIHRQLATLEMESGRWDCATRSLQRILDVDGYDALAHRDKGIALLKSSRPAEAIGSLETALQLQPDIADAEQYLGKAAEIVHWDNRASIPHLAPMLRLTEQERADNEVSEEKLDFAIKMFRENGVVVVENAFPRELIEDISKIVFQKYDDYFEDREYEDNLVLGDKRRMVTLALEGGLNSSRLYGSKILVGMMSNLLDKDYVMGGVNAVVSLPGSKDQGLHKDYSPLFKSEENHDTHVTPAFAVAMLIPLIDMTREHGTTSFRKKSHLVPEQMPFEMPTQEPLLRMGDCVVFDYRTAHEGLGNQSSEVRPLLCVIHHRIWFRDALNYNQQKDVLISPEELEKVPEEFKKLFKWVTH